MALWSSQFDCNLPNDIHPFWLVLGVPSHPWIPVILRSVWTSSYHLSFGLPTFVFSPNFASNTIIGIHLFSSLVKWSRHSSLLSLTLVIVSVFWHKLLSFTCNQIRLFCGLSVTLLSFKNRNMHSLTGISKVLFPCHACYLSIHVFVECHKAY